MRMMPGCFAVQPVPQTTHLLQDAQIPKVVVRKLHDPQVRKDPRDQKDRKEKRRAKPAMCKE